MIYKLGDDLGAYLGHLLGCQGGFKFSAKRSEWFEFQPKRTRDHKVEAPVHFHPEGSLPVAGDLYVGLDVREEVGHVLRGVQIWNNLFLEICNSAGN